MNFSNSFLSSHFIQQALYKLICSNPQEALYSLFKRCCKTSNCKAPTVPKILRPSCFFVNNCATPSSVNCSKPFCNCLVFIGSILTTYLNNSGEKLGIPLK